MTSISLEVPIVGQKNTSEEPKVGNSIKKTEEFINGGNLDGTTNIKAEGILEANLTAAVVTKLNQKSSGLETKKQTGSLTGAAGFIYLMETNAATLTLPAATANVQVGIICTNGFESVKLKAGVGAKIFGDFVLSTGAGEITLTENQHVIVEADGTNWRIISGEPKREQVYTTGGEFTVASSETSANQEASKVRPALVYGFVKSPGATPTIELKLIVAGVELPGLFTMAETANRWFPLNFALMPGQKWKMTSSVLSVGTWQVAFKYLLQ